jgi:predicted SnoaL-like aldol condensation-catalyzing enzyme
MTEAQQDTNKSNVTAFHDLMFNECRPAEAIERYAGDSYTQHNLTCRRQGCVHRLPRADGLGVPQEAG